MSERPDDECTFCGGRGHTRNDCPFADAPDLRNVPTRAVWRVRAYVRERRGNGSQIIAGTGLEPAVVYRCLAYLEARDMVYAHPSNPRMSMPTVLWCSGRRPSVIPRTRCQRSEA